MSKLAALKEFVPGRIMIVVLVFVSLAGAAYLISANNRGDHLTRRNFHSLNAIAANIGASLETLDAVVEFAEPACGNEGDIKAVAQCIKEKLGGAGTAISGGTINQIEIRDEQGRTEASQQKFAGTDAAKPTTSCKADEEVNAKARQFYINRGRATLDGPLINKVYHVTESSGGKAIRCLEVIIAYDILNSGKAKEGFFDSTVIAQYKEGKDFAQVISNSADSGVRVSSDNIRQLFSSRSEAVRLRTLQELEISAANERAAAFTLSEDGASFSRPKDATRIPFSQSTVASIEIGRQSFYAFIQPVVMDARRKLESDLVIVGLVKTGRFNQDKYQLSYNLLYFLLLLLLTAGLVISLLHLALIGRRELLHRKNTLLANLSAIGLQAMAVLIIMQFVSVQDLNKLFQSSTKGIFDSIRAEFSRELEDRYTRLAEKQPDLLCPECSEPRVKELYSRKYRGVENFFLLDGNGKNIGTYRSNREKPASPGFSVPDRDYFSRIKQGAAWVYNANRSTDAPEAKKGRAYLLDRIESKADGEIATVLSIGFDAANNENCVADEPCVLAYTTHFASLRNTVLPAGFGFAVFDNASGKVLFHSDRRRSLRENFYQATDDNKQLKAKVIAALEAELNLDYKGENIEAFVGPLKDGIPWSLAVYHRSSVPDILSFHFGLTGGILVILGLATMGMAAAALVGTLGIALTSPDQRETFRWRKILQLPRWMCPLRGRARKYRLLSLCLVAAIPVSAGLVYYTDEFLWFWYFAPPLTALLVWHRLIRSEFYGGEGELTPKFDRVGWTTRAIGLLTPVFALALLLLALIHITCSGGAWFALACVIWLLIVARIHHSGKAQSSQRNKPRHGLVVYAQTVTLFGVLCAVFPTLMLLNRNYDVHEQLWVRYSQWDTVDRLKARYNHLHQDASTLKLESQMNEFILKDWTGIYLPRTELVLLDDLDSSGSQENLAAFARNNLLNAGARGEYYNAYLLAYSAKAAKPMPGKMDPLLSRMFYDSGALSADHHTLPRGLSAWLPELNDTGDMIRSFDQSSQRMDAPACACQHLFDQTDSDPDSEIDTGAGVQSWLSSDDPRWSQIRNIEDRQELKKIIYQETDDRAGITYRIMNWYPHTRSPSAEWRTKLVVGFVGALALISWLFYLLNRWLISRFFTDAFEDGLYRFPPEKDDARSPFAEGAIIVTAPGTTLECFKKRCAGLYGEDHLTDLAKLNLRNLDATAHWTITRSECAKTTIAWLESKALSDQTLDPKILDFLDRTYREGDTLIILAGLDLSYALTEAYAYKASDLRKPYPLSRDNCLAWRAFLSDLNTFYMKDQDKGARRQLERDLYDAWETSSNDEQMVLAALIYEDRTNPLNTQTLTSLYRRGLICTSHYGFTLSYPEMKPIIKARCSYQEYRLLRDTYENETWLAWKKPIIVVLTLLLLFVLFVARDQLSGVFSLIATVLTGIATVGLISERVRGFKSALLDETG